MRVVLSGTSNSIIAKGISSVFGTHPSVTRFDNVSYGASGSVALGDHLCGIDFLNYDFLILDYCVNEETFIMDDESTHSAAMNNLCAAIDAASLAGCQPIILIFPGLNLVSRHRPFEDAIMTALSPLGVPVFNCYKFLQDLAVQSHIAFNALFLDPMHIRREIGRFVGEAAVKYMKSAQSNPKPQGIKSALYYQPIGFVPQHDLRIEGNHRIMRRETKLVSVEILHINPSSEIRVPAPCGSEIIGLTCNASRSIGSLRDATTQVLLHTIKPWSLFSKERGLTLVTLPITNPMMVGSDPACIEYDFKGETTQTQPKPALEICGFVIRYSNTRRPVHIATLTAGPVALEDSVEMTERDNLIRSLQKTPAA